MTNDNSAGSPTDIYRWIRDKAGNEVLQQRWTLAPEWRTAGPDAPQDIPKMFSVDYSKPHDELTNPWD